MWFLRATEEAKKKEEKKRLLKLVAQHSKDNNTGNLTSPFLFALIDNVKKNGERNR